MVYLFSLDSSIENNNNNTHTHIHKLGMGTYVNPHESLTVIKKHILTFSNSIFKSKLSNL